MANRMNFILMFDIQNSKSALQRKINRDLHKIRAMKIQKSVWKSSNFEALNEIANKIKQESAMATILKEDIIVPY